MRIEAAHLDEDRRVACCRLSRLQCMCRFSRPSSRLCGWRENVSANSAVVVRKLMAPHKRDPMGRILGLIQRHLAGARERDRPLTKGRAAARFATHKWRPAMASTNKSRHQVECDGRRTEASYCLGVIEQETEKLGKGSSRRVGTPRFECIDTRRPTCAARLYGAAIPTGPTRLSASARCCRRLHASAGCGRRTPCEPVDVGSFRKQWS